MRRRCLCSTTTSREKREEILKDLGVDIIIEKKFDSEFMRLSCREFVQKYLNDLLGARYAAAGFNYRFGKGGEGDVETLAKLCGEFGITTETVGEVTLGGKTVSSSRIRAAVADGDVESAAQMLLALQRQIFPFPITALCRKRAYI